jgi:cell division protein FtsI/penicillin-binding protein 2
MKNLTRFAIVGILFSVIGLAFMGQLVRIQISGNFQVVGVETGENFNNALKYLYASRGNIYDRWGNLLAGNKEVFEIDLDRTQLNNPSTIADILTEYCIDYAQYRYNALPDNTIQQTYHDWVYDRAAELYPEVNPNLQTYVLCDNLPFNSMNKILDKQKEYEEDNLTGEDAPSLEGINPIGHVQRTYPENELAAGLLGVKPFSGEGFLGIEGEYDKLLSGEEITLPVKINPYQAKELPNNPRGADLILTIDRDIQSMVETTLLDAVEKNNAVSGTIVVMDLRDGEEGGILAMASISNPSTSARFNPNRFWEYPRLVPQLYMFNRAISQPYEPGSVFKILTMAIALDTGAVTPTQEYLDTGYIDVGGPVVNWDGGAYGLQSMTGCLEHSLNVCLAWIATQIGEEDFYYYLIDRFDISKLSNIDLAGEVTYRLRTPSSHCDPQIPGDCWTLSDLGRHSYGQSVSVTVIQLMKAVSAVANDGKMVQPHVVRYVVAEGQQFPIFSEGSFRQVIKQETAITLSEMLANSLVNESSLALVDGYRVAGKTGTASIAENGRYLTDATNASFIGWGPVDDPQFMVYVWLERPAGEWGSVVATPVFSEVFKNLTVLTDLPPDAERLRLKENSGQ